MTPPTLTRPSPARPDIRWLVWAVPVIVAAVAVIITGSWMFRGPAFVDRVTIVNDTAFDVNVDVAGSDGRVLGLKYVSAGGTAVVRDVIDQGDTWEFQFSYGGTDAGTLRRARSSLERSTVCFVGAAILVAGLAEELGVSDAIGAFMVGLVMAESPAAGRIKELVLPLRDAFAAAFFFAFGLTIDPSDVGDVVGPVAIAVVLSIILNVTAGLIAARIQGFGRTPAANIGLTILGRGEFSLILATLATAAGLDPRIGPFVALYVLILAVLGPLLAARSRSLSRLLPDRLFPATAGPGPPRPPE